jgi:hypothetical protein
LSRDVATVCIGHSKELFATGPTRSGASHQTNYGTPLVLKITGIDCVVARKSSLRSAPWLLGISMAFAVAVSAAEPAVH